MRSAEQTRPATAAKPTQIRFQSHIPLVAPAEVRQDSLIRQLALDRLRDLHDDGVTMDYIGRMYDVSGARMRAIEDELRRRGRD